MNYLDDILRDQGLEYEDLNYEEREFYNAANVKTQTVTPTDLNNRIVELIYSLCLQLTETSDDQKHYQENRVLKARLKNYLLLHLYLDSPKKAQEALKASIEARKNTKGIKPIS